MHTSLDEPNAGRYPVEQENDMTDQEAHKAWVENQVLGLLNTIPGPYKFTYESPGESVQKNVTLDEWAKAARGKQYEVKP